MTAAETRPLILTLKLDAVGQQFFDAQRSKYFPPERNFLRAHLTLFHHLPPAELPSIHSYLFDCCRQMPVMELKVSGLRSLGRGVAYSIVCPQLSQLHHTLQAHWQEWLTPQDRQKLQPHITIQNKVTPAAAKSLMAMLAPEFEPFTVAGRGLSLFAYESGPWAVIQDFDFAR